MAACTNPASRFQKPSVAPRLLPTASPSYEPSRHHAGRAAARARRSLPVTAVRRVAMTVTVESSGTLETIWKPAAPQPAGARIAPTSGDGGVRFAQHAGVCGAAHGGIVFDLAGVSGRVPVIAGRRRARPPISPSTDRARAMPSPSHSCPALQKRPPDGLRMFFAAITRSRLSTAPRCRPTLADTRQHYSGKPLPRIQTATSTVRMFCSKTFRFARKRRAAWPAMKANR